MNTAAATAPETKMRNVNSNTPEVLQVPRNGLVVPFRNDSPRDTFEIEVQNLPVEHFKGDGKAVLSFASTTGFVAALRHRGEGEVGSYLYSDQGERYDSDIQGAPFLPYLISGRSILAKLRGQGKEGLLMEQPHSLEELQVTSRFLTFTALCSNLHIPPESQEQLRGEIMAWVKGIIPKFSA